MYVCCLIAKQTSTAVIHDNQAVTVGLVAPGWRRSGVDFFRVLSKTGARQVLGRFSAGSRQTAMLKMQIYVNVAILTWSRTKRNRKC